MHHFGDRVRETALDAGTVDRGGRELVGARRQVFDNIACNARVIDPDRIAERTAIAAPEDPLGRQIGKLRPVLVLRGRCPAERDGPGSGSGRDYLDRECR